MIGLLYLIALAVLLFAGIAGIISGSITGFLTAVGGGITSAAVFFALAKILDNQEKLMHQLRWMEGRWQEEKTAMKKACPKCNRMYDGDMNSCPHCGYRE